MGHPIIIYIHGIKTKIGYANIFTSNEFPSWTNFTLAAHFINKIEHCTSIYISIFTIIIKFTIALVSLIYRRNKFGCGGVIL